MKRINLPRVKQKGFTLIELLIVLGIIAVLAVVGVPKVQSLQMEGRAPEVAKSVQSSVLKLANNREGGGTWASATTEELAQLLASDSRVTVAGAAPNRTVVHNLGGGAGGTLAFAPGTIAAANDAGQITAANVHGDACPILANALQKFAKVMVVNATTVKAAGGNYNGAAAQTACVSGETNAVVLRFQ